jgi:hypothetical protein
MSTQSSFVHRLPQRGWVLSTELAEAVDISDETIKDWLRDFAIPHKKLGTRTFIDMAAFFENLPDGPTDAPQTTKKSKR